MSTLEATQISDKTKTVPGSVITTGSGKAFGSQVLDSAANGDDYNTTSITDNGAGNNTHAFTNNFANILYSSAGGEFWNTAHARSQTMKSDAITTSDVVIMVGTNSGNSSGVGYNIIFYGDLA